MFNGDLSSGRRRSSTSSPSKAAAITIIGEDQFKVLVEDRSTLTSIINTAIIQPNNTTTTIQHNNKTTSNNKENRKKRPTFTQIISKGLTTIQLKNRLVQLRANELLIYSIKGMSFILSQCC